MTITITEHGSALHASTPYSQDFISWARNAGGRWNPDEKIWAFRSIDRPTLERKIGEIYGITPTDAEDKVRVRLTARTDQWQHRGQIEFGPVPLCRAYGRDSGARTCPDVVLIDGKIGSGGSHKNWRTIAEAGAVFELEVPRKLAVSNDDWTVEIMDEKSDRINAIRTRLAAIDAERAALVDELATLGEK